VNERQDIFVIPVYTTGQLLNVRRTTDLAARQGFTPVVVCNSQATATALANDPLSMSIGRNTGYGGAANLVAERYDFDTILLCNDDLVFTEPGMKLLHAGVTQLSLTGGAAILGLLPKERTRITPIPTVPVTLALVSGFSTVTRRYAERRAVRNLQNVSLDPSHDPVLLGDGLAFPFVCVALTRKAWDQLGRFDDRFPLYFEDTDILARASKEAIPVHVALGECTHNSSSSSRTVVPYIVPLMAVGARNYLRLHRRVSSLMASCLVTVALVARALGWVPLRRDRLTELRAVARAIVAVWSSQSTAMPPW
jgi:hypothetical protein